MKYLITVLLTTLLFSCMKTEDKPLSGNKRQGLIGEAILSNSLAPIADVYAWDANINTNYGTVSPLVVKRGTTANYNRTAYIRFGLSGITGNVTSAKLRMNGRNTQDATVVNMGLYTTVDTWTETGLTWSNKPAKGAQVASANVTSTQSWIEWDVTSAVKSELAGDKVLSLAIDNVTTQGKAVEFLSRESTTNKPELVITTDDTVAEAIDKPDQIFVVWFENKGFTQIIGSGNAPYFDSLAKWGTLFNDAHALWHPSYPNYLSFFGGSRNGWTTDDCIYGQPFSTKNMYTQLDSVGKTLRWYSENMGFAGNDSCNWDNGNYVERHNPVTAWSNVPQTTVNLTFESVNWEDTANFKNLGNFVGITPNLYNDMHGTPSTTSTQEIQTGNAWMKAKLNTLVQYAKTHNIIVMVYFDEDNGTTDNKIPVIMVGKHIKKNYKALPRYDHYDFARSCVQWLGGNGMWTSSTISTTQITGIFE